MGAYHFFNDPEVRVKLHVERFGFAKNWTPCNEKVETNYTKNENSSYHMYPILMRAGYRIWVYSGDVDANVPITGTINWLQKLREDFHVKIDRPWREWWIRGRNKDEDQVAGMVWRLQNLTFVSVRGAGHMVPRDKPLAGATIIDHFLAGSELPEKQ